MFMLPKSASAMFYYIRPVKLMGSDITYKDKTEISLIRHRRDELQCAQCRACLKYFVCDVGRGVDQRQAARS